MLEFRTVEITDLERAKRLLSYSDYRGCEYSYANNLAWAKHYKSKVAFFEEFYISCSEHDGLYFTFPAGSGDLKKVIEEMRSYAESKGQPLVIGSVDDERCERLREIYHDGFDIVQDPDGYDYIYNSADLIGLAGKKYHGKRNHLKKIYGYDFSYSEMTDADFDDCIVFAAQHYNSRDGASDDSQIGEQYAINTFFGYFHELGLSGGVLRIDGKVAAFTIGEQLNSDTLDIHIEKADPEINGAYPAINNFYAKQAAADLKYINREEDLGIEGLRKSKLSYYPAFMQVKNIAVFK